MIVGKGNGLDTVRVIRQLQKEKAHGQLVDAALGSISVQKSPYQVFQQILDREDVPHPEVQEGDPGVPGQEAVDQEVPYGRRRGFQKGHYPVKKIRHDHEIDRYISFSCRHDLLLGILVHDQKLPFPQKELTAVDDVAGGPGTHVDHFNIVMGMPWEIDEAGMGTDLDQTAFVQDLPVINDKTVQIGRPCPVVLFHGIERFLHAGALFQDILFFLCDFS